MTKIPEVSVITPVFNKAHSLNRAMMSVLNQSYCDFEFIIVDDGSTDNTSEIVEEFKDKRIKYIRHEINLGPAAARNTGVKAAQGKFIAFLDADDEWLPNKLSCQIPQMRKNPQVAACFCGFYIQNSRLYRETYERVIVPLNQKNWHRHLMIRCGLGPGTTMVVRRKWFDEIGFFDESLKRYEDWDWLLRLSNIAMLEVVQLPLAKINRGGSPPPASIIEEASHLFLHKHASEFLKYRIYGRKAIAMRYLENALYFYKEKKFAKGRFYLRKCLIYYPFQRLEVYLKVLDAALGTTIMPYLIKIFNKLGLKYGKFR